jgi:hypothetical protein
VHVPPRFSREKMFVSLAVYAAWLCIEASGAVAGLADEAVAGTEKKVVNLAVLWRTFRKKDPARCSQPGSSCGRWVGGHRRRPGVVDYRQVARGVYAHFPFDPEMVS